MGFCEIKIKEIERLEDKGTGYMTEIRAEHINKKHLMQSLAKVVLTLAEGEDKNYLIMVFTRELLKDKIDNE